MPDNPNGAPVVENCPMCGELLAVDDHLINCAQCGGEGCTENCLTGGVGTVCQDCTDANNRREDAGDPDADA